MSSLQKSLVAAFLPACLASCDPAPLPSAEVSSRLIDNVVIIDGTGSTRQPVAADSRPANELALAERWLAAQRACDRVSHIAYHRVKWPRLD
jgi:hypothetical protein